MGYEVLNGTELIQGDYKRLAEIAQHWGDCAQITRNMSATLDDHLRILQSGEWTGDAADEFYATMNQDVQPGFDRLNQAFYAGETTVNRVIALFYAAEDEACGCLNLTSEANGGTNDFYRVVPDEGNGGVHQSGGNGQDLKKRLDALLTDDPYTHLPFPPGTAFSFNVDEWLADALEQRINDGEISWAHVAGLLAQAEAGNRGALVALLALGGSNLQDSGDFTETFGIKYMGEYGGNCATFASLNMLMAGMETDDIWGFERASHNTSNLLNMGALFDISGSEYITNGDDNVIQPNSAFRSVTELRNYWELRGGRQIVLDNYKEWQAGDLIFTMGSNSREYDHVSVVVGFGFPEGSTVYATYNDAWQVANLQAKLTGEKPEMVIPYAVDHGYLQAGQAPTPYTNTTPKSQYSNKPGQSDVWVTMEDTIVRPAYPPIAAN